MTRRHKDDGGSLELLLDTICNTFGGIVFIAILVVILLQISHPESEQQPTERADPVVLEERRNELSVLKAKTARARSAAASQRKILEKFAPDRVREQLRNHQHLVETAEKLTDQRDDVLTDNSREAQAIESLRNDIANTQTQLQDARHRVDDLESQIEKEREQRTERARMPIVQSAGVRREIGLILRYGRMYVWHQYDQFGSRQGLNTDEFAVVGERDGQLITSPIPTAGVALDGTPKSRQLIKQRLQRFRPDQSYISAVVRPDSFREFRHLRDVLIGLKFKYRLIPMEDGGSVADRGGSGGQVQ